MKQNTDVHPTYGKAQANFPINCSASLHTFVNQRAHARRSTLMKINAIQLEITVDIISSVLSRLETPFPSNFHSSGHYEGRRGIRIRIEIFIIAISSCFNIHDRLLNCYFY